MAKREQTVRVWCHEPGCKETGFYSADSRKDAARISREYGDKWMCTRHSGAAGSLLTPTNLTRTTRQVACKVDSPYLEGKLFWDGQSGFTFGHDYKAYAQDFPPGTVLEVTARIILPSD